MPATINELIKSSCETVLIPAVNGYRSELKEILEEGNLTTRDLRDILEEIDSKSNAIVLSESEKIFTAAKPNGVSVGDIGNMITSEQGMVFTDLEGAFADLISNGELIIEYTILNPRDLRGSDTVASVLNRELMLSREPSDVNRFQSSYEDIAVVVSGNLEQFLDQGHVLHVNDPEIVCGSDVVQLVGETVRIPLVESKLTFEDPWR